MTDEHEKHGYPVFLPSGRPAPAVMTADEAASFLRLDDGPNPLRTLKFYRDSGQLAGVRLGRRVRYPLPEVLRFLAEKTALSRHNGLVGHNSMRA